MSYPALIAHRGYAGIYPENTVGAVEAAAMRPETDGIEIDVRATDDGVPVVFHDDRLGTRRDGSPGLTTGSGFVHEKTANVVTTLEVLESGETIPTLRSLCEVLEDDIHLTVELKRPDSGSIYPNEALSASVRARQQEHWESFIATVVEILSDCSIQARLASFCHAAVVEAAEYSFETAPICTVENVKASFDLAQQYDCTGIHTDIRSITGSPGDGESAFEVMSAARSAGIDVVGWTARTWYDATQLIAASVDGVTADYPNLYEWSASNSAY